MQTDGSRALSRAERLDWLRLSRSENVGPITFRQLLARYGSAGEALAALPELARRGGRTRPIRICDRAEAEAELEALDKLDARLIALCEPEYPTALAALEDAPPLIACLGHVHLLERPAVGVVGARNASANGRRLARQMAAELAAAGLLVVSGLARGIDAAAHEGALENGTAAVVAGGFDVVYPEENAELQEQIARQGAILSEMPAGTVPQARHFPRRNRLISGMSRGVVVVEAAPRSGSLITARFALDQGREVFAVPGSPLDPRARGCNNLIRQGALLVESAADVLEALESTPSRPTAEPKAPEFLAGAAPEPDRAEVERVLDRVKGLLGPDPVPVDELIRQCQVSPALVQTALLELELAGRAERHPGNRVALIAGCRAAER
ncbi:MAG TPA: DNA-processing protein DprA [Kiloniellales bacterium]|nr:DNA-processing protein DprA [Kiloniellales bacterium]